MWVDEGRAGPDRSVNSRLGHCVLEHGLEVVGCKKISCVVGIIHQARPWGGM